MSIQGLKSEDLYTVCKECNGTGRKKEVSANWTNEGPCYTCGQQGYQLTAEGKVLKDFMLKMSR